MANVNIKPLGDRVLLEICENTEEMKGGILIPDSAKEKPQEYKVIALGTGKNDDTATRSRSMSKSAISCSPAVTAEPKSKSQAKNTKSLRRMISSLSSAEQYNQGVFYHG